MRKACFLLIGLAAIIFSQSCHRPSASDKLEQIDVLLGKEDYVNSRKMADELLCEFSDSAKVIPAGELMRLAAVYVVLADKDSTANYDDDIMNAGLLYVRAFKESPDTSVSFVSTGDPEHAASWELLNRLLINEVDSIVITDYEASDSVEWAEIFAEE